ncbi:MAG: ATP synthase subunit I [Desulfobacterales bacterium]
MFRELAYYSSLGFSVALAIFIGVAIRVAYRQMAGHGAWGMFLFRFRGCCRRQKYSLGRQKAKTCESVNMVIQQRLLTFILRSNWILLALAAAVGHFTAPSDVTLGIIAGGLIVSVNFHLLYRTLKKSLTPPHLASPNIVLVKYYIQVYFQRPDYFILDCRGLRQSLGMFVGFVRGGGKYHAGHSG